jgi:hypothetical protein
MSKYILTHKHHTHPHNASGWRIHCGVEVTELSTNKQHTLPLWNPFSLEELLRSTAEDRVNTTVMAWNLFVDTVCQTQNSRGTVRKAMSRTQHRQLAGAFDFYAKAVEALVAKRKTCNPPAGSQIQTAIHTCCRMVLQTVLLFVLVSLVVDLLHTLSTHKHAYPCRLALVV